MAVECGTRLQLLGAFELTAAGREVRLPSSAQRLLAYLALLGRPAQRGHVAAALWTNSTDEQAQASLRSALWRVRRGCGDSVVCVNGSLALNPAVDLDVRRVMALASSLIADTCSEADLVTDPALLQGELLPGWYEDWVVYEQERLRQLNAHALERLAEVLAGRQQFGLAVDAALSAIQIEPLRESAHRVLIRIHLQEGNRGEAVRQFKRLTALLRTELCIEPGVATTSLLDAGGMVRDAQPHGSVTGARQGSRGADPSPFTSAGDHRMAGARLSA